MMDQIFSIPLLHIKAILNCMHISSGTMSKMFLNIVIGKVEENYIYQMITTEEIYYSLEIIDISFTLLQS